MGEEVEESRREEAREKLASWLARAAAQSPCLELE